MNFARWPLGQALVVDVPLVVVVDRCQADVLEHEEQPNLQM